jgi:hypothetical protein
MMRRMMMIPQACTTFAWIDDRKHWEIPLIVEAPACNCTV